MGKDIQGYKVIGDWHMVAEGAWAQVEKNGTTYFMKKYVNVATEPDRSKIGPLFSEKAYEQHLATFNTFKSRRDRLNRSLWQLTDHGGNVVSPFDCFVYEHAYTEVTDFYGENLSESKIIELPANEKVLLLRTLAAALRSVHSKGIVHSDIKATNVICSKTSKGKYVLKLIDFGGSYFVDDKPDDVEEFLGDQNYASPELGMVWMCGEAEEDPEEYIAKLNQKSDIFSLGLLFHLFLCGKRPLYKGLNFGELFGDRDERLIYPFEIVLNGGTLEALPEIANEEYRTLINSMLMPEPDDRPTAEEVLASLRKIPLPFRQRKSLLSRLPFKKKKAVEVEEEELITIEIDPPWEKDEIAWEDDIEELLKLKEYKQLKRKGNSFLGDAYCLVSCSGKKETLKKEDLLAMGFAKVVVTDRDYTVDDYGDTDEILRARDQSLYHVNTELLRSKNLKLRAMEKENAATRRPILGYEVYDTVNETKTFVSTVNLVLQRYLLHKM